MKTDKIKEKIEQTKIKLIPLFALTDAEKNKLQTPIIIREFDRGDYPETSRPYPGYDGLRNVIYFPYKSAFEEGTLGPDGKSFSSFSYTDLFLEDQFVYFVSSFLHHQINPRLREHALEVLITGKTREEYFELRSLVGTYPQIMMGLIDMNNRRAVMSSRDAFHVFIDYGPAFLPALARMSLEDAIERRIIKKIE